MGEGVFCYIPKGNAASEAGKFSEDSFIFMTKAGRLAAGRCFFEMTTYSEGKWIGSTCRFSGHSWYSERKKQREAGKRPDSAFISERLKRSPEISI